MKNILLTVLGTFLLSPICIAQTTSDIFDIANTKNLGTARYNGLSGAFGALGGDLTAVTENPAGGAVFVNSYGSVTLAQDGRNFDSNYFNRTSQTSDKNTRFNQVGGLLILRNTNETTSINKISLGFLYNKDNDYRNEYLSIGNSNSGSIGDYFIGQATGFSADDISVRDDESFEDAYVNIGESDGFESRGQQAFLAREAFLITENENNDRLYNSDITGNNNLQEISTITSGGSSKFTINLAFEINKKIYLGGNLNFHNYDLRKNTLLNEINSNTSNNVSEVFFETRSRTFGNGISLNLGGIAKVSDQLRLGLSYQTPTWSTLQDELDQNITSFLRDQSGQPRNVDPRIVSTYPEYDLKTPGEVSASIAYIFGKNGLFSAQYTRKDFSNIEYGNNAFEFDILNNRIKNTFQAINTVKAGGEYRYEKWRLRGGLSYSSSPYKNDRLAGESQGFSLGAGYDWGKWKLDFSYNHFEIDSNDLAFENENYSNASFINTKQNVLSATLGVNF